MTEGAFFGGFWAPVPFSDLPSATRHLNAGLGHVSGGRGMSRLGRRRGLLGPEGLSTSRQSRREYGMAEILSPAGRYSMTTVRQNGGAIAMSKAHTQTSRTTGSQSK